jgi:5,5'-dehydrodivanillate O-demethylase
MNQDFVAWAGQGTVADRTKEHLGESDRGVIMIRKRLLDDAEAVARGGEPKGLIRDPARNECVALPIIARDHFVKGYAQADIDQRPGGTRGLALGREFPFQAGQPAEVRAAFRRAMGLDAG